MKRQLIPALILLCLPPLAQAGAYKCRQPNGAIAFQDHPCENGAAGSRVNLAPAQGYTAEGLGQASSSSWLTQRAASDRPLSAADLERLNAANNELQADAARMRAENPDWQKSTVLKRLNDQAEAINARVQEDNRKAH